MDDPTLLVRAARFVAMESGLPMRTGGPTPISESRYVAAMRRVQGRVERRILELEVQREEDAQQRKAHKSANSNRTSKPRQTTDGKAPFVTKV